MKKKFSAFLASILAISLLMCPALAISSFPDVSDSAEYAEAVEYLNDIGIMQGDTNGNFNPNNTVTRAQMAAIICRMLGEAENLTTDGSRFTDVPVSHWANGYIIKAASLGIISGYQDGSFKPNNPVTYEQAIKMLICALGFSAEAIENGGYPEGYIVTAENYGYTAGLSAKRGDAMSRWQIAQLVYNLSI